MTEEQAPTADEQAALDERNRVARESIEKARAMWLRRQASLRPLPRVGALEALHAGMRERVATSVFGREIRQPDYCCDVVTYMQVYPRMERDYGPYVCLPCTHSIQPLSDIALAALITFINRGNRARAGTLVSDGTSFAEIVNEPI